MIFRRRTSAAASGVEAWSSLVAACRHRLIDQNPTSAADAALTAATIAGELLMYAGVPLLESTIAALAADAIGIDPLRALLDEPGVTEIMVNGTQPIWCERDGKLQQTKAQFRDVEALLVAIEQLLASTGRRVDAAHPLLDARLSDGSRINVVLPPLAPEPLLTIRRFSSHWFNFDALVESGTVARPIAAFLHAAVLGRSNILVCGPAGTGKTTTLAALAGLIPHSQRVVVIEDVAELQINHPNVAAQQCRPSGGAEVAQIGLDDLVRNALRMRPDRLIVGEVRGREAAIMIEALSTGHAGSMATLHASSCAEALLRLETLVAMGMPQLDTEVLRRWIGQVLDVVVRVDRDAAGVRRIVEVCAVDSDSRSTALVSVFDADDDGVIQPSGVVPRRWLHRAEAHGIAYPAALFANVAA